MVLTTRRPSQRSARQTHADRQGPPGELNAHTSFTNDKIVEGSTNKLVSLSLAVSHHGHVAQRRPAYVGARVAPTLAYIAAAGSFQTEPSSTTEMAALTQVQFNIVVGIAPQPYPDNRPEEE